MQFRMNSRQVNRFWQWFAAVTSRIQEKRKQYPRLRIGATGSIRRLLDIGCGRGGTAEWFNQRGWGTVIGIDIDHASIECATGRYPGVEFLQLDVADLGRLERGPFDLAYVFNSFYAFPNQQTGLERYVQRARQAQRL
jgi:SAM-dependent methyltransferase